MPKWVEGTVVNQKRWTQNLFTLQVEADLAAFEGGQFAKLALAVGGEMIARPYSFVNAPEERPHEFYYVTLPDGPLTQRLHTMEAGDAIYLAPRPAGFLVLSEIPDADSLSRLLGEHGEQMRVVSFVSREERPGVLHGRVPLAIEEGRLEAAAGVALSAKTSQVMICGNPEMVTDTNEALARRGMKKHRRREPGHITVENYW